MLFVVIIFFIAITCAFGMLAFRAWEIRTGRITGVYGELHFPKFSLLDFEKNMLHLAKYVTQWVILGMAKIWFLASTKAKKWLMDKWPKVHGIFTKKAPETMSPVKPSFFTKALLESKGKIKRMKQKIREEHEME